MIKLRVLVAVLLLSCLSGCGLLRPDETAMKTAIGDYVLQQEEYPREFVLAENFVFSNLVKVVDSDPVQYKVDAEFDFTYKADGDVIVAALDEKRRKEREKEKRRTNNPFEEIKGAVSGAFENLRYENRFKNVRLGDQDHYSGNFTLSRNADNSWRVSDASYQ
ncbi:MAG TPA: hypothetical protein PLF92_00640 [Arenimonas sp.]|nr:hypothetical protein [Arenimonas sp.]HOZ03992.1 hypothetical protein [Arenimonas sp.]HPO24195.1 hypothetical protein [Arenimonas sp.]HPW31390.1 hypothetical protein [Arenimonas sp.]